MQDQNIYVATYSQRRLDERAFVLCGQNLVLPKKYNAEPKIHVTNNRQTWHEEKAFALYKIFFF